MTASDQSECVTLAFYGIRPAGAGIRPYCALLQWLFAEIQVDGEDVGLSLQDKRQRAISGPTTPMRLEAIPDLPRVADVLTMQARIPPPDHLRQVADFRLSVGCSLRDSYLVIACTEDLLAPGDASVARLCEGVCRHCVPGYGIGFLHPATNGAIYYAMGVNYGSDLPSSDEEWEQAERISRWGHTALPERVYEDGLFRDVYRWNIVSDAQLNSSLSGKPLRAYIETTDGAGKLLPLAPGVSLWTVDESRIAAVRDVLEAAGRIFH